MVALFHADQLLLFLALRTEQSIILGRSDIAVPEFSYRYDDNQLALRSDRKIFMLYQNIVHFILLCER